MKIINKNNIIKGDNIKIWDKIVNNINYKKSQNN